MGVAAAFLAACGGLQPPVSGVRALGEDVTLASTYKVLHSFKGGKDGATPLGEEAPLAVMNGLLYGTTQAGGVTSCDCGTVFQVSPLGAESVLYGFKGESEGGNPTGTVIYFKGEWYGMTAGGGTGDNGIVYAVDKSGKEHVVYRFKGRGDGAGPFGRLLAYKGMLYGTTVNGGRNRLGTVFAVTPSGTEHVLHSFKLRADGANPYAGLTELNGTLYGTTIAGGLDNAGTVFAISASGNERVIYSFQYGTDGAGPQAPLTALGGKLYGTTTSGGGQGYGGIVFEVSPSGIERVLHRFKDRIYDGASPQSALLDLNGTLYGTTLLGGRKGLGTVFGLTLSGKERILHNFRGSPDGRYPTGGVIAINNTLYGTTTGGGTGPCYNGLGCGTIFALTP